MIYVQFREYFATKLPGIINETKDKTRSEIILYYQQIIVPDIFEKYPNMKLKVFNYNEDPPTYYTDKYLNEYFNYALQKLLEV